VVGRSEFKTAGLLLRFAGQQDMDAKPLE